MDLITTFQSVWTAIRGIAPIAVVNIAIIAILVICGWQGFKKGIIMGIIGVLVIILSLFGADLLSDTFSSEVLPVMKPFVSGIMDTRIEETTYQVLGIEPDANGNYSVSLSLNDLIDSQPDSRTEICRWVYRDLGLYDTLANTMAQQTVSYADQNGANITTAVSTTLCQSVAWYGTFIIAFILIFTVLTVIVNLPNLSFRIPYIGIVNDIGGLVIGLYTGLLICSILLLFLQFAGLILPEDTLRTSRFAAFILDQDLLSTYITF